MKYGITGITGLAGTLKEEDYPKIAMRFEKVESIFEAEDIKDLSDKEVQFLQDCRRATTDGPVRIRRTEFLLSLVK